MATFTEEELASLLKTQTMRERLANVIMDKPDAELPKKPAELMAVTNLLESIDRSVLGRAKLRIEDDAVKNEEANKGLLWSLMQQLHTNPGAVIDVPATQVTTPAVSGPPAYTPSEGSVIRPGELILKTDVPELPEEFQ